MNLTSVSKYFWPYRILDIGANIGQFHQLAKAAYPSSFVFSIEASEACEPELQKVTSHYYIGLLARERKTYEFYSRQDCATGTGDSLYRELTPWYNDQNVKVIEKQGIPLDDLFTEESEFDLIKIDTQGSELDIISGGKALCQRAKGIILEVSLVPYNDGAPLKDEVLAYMQTLGFAPKETLGIERHPITGDIIQENTLFVRNDNADLSSVS